MCTRLPLMLLALSLAALPLAHAAPKPKLAICHAQDEGRWKLLTLPQPAVNAHLAHHDDAFPGGVTAQSGTPLDETCTPPTPAAACPCEGLTNPPVTWDSSFVTATCTVDTALGVTTIATAPPETTATLTVSGPAASCALLLGPGSPPVVEGGLSPEEVSLCAASLAAIAAEDSVVCTVVP